MDPSILAATQQHNPTNNTAKIDEEADYGNGGDRWEEDDLALGNLLNHLNDNTTQTNNGLPVPRLHPPPPPSLHLLSFDRQGSSSNNDNDYSNEGGGDDIGGGGWDDNLNFTIDNDDNEDDTNGGYNNDNNDVSTLANKNPTSPPPTLLGGGDGSAGSTGSRWPFNDTSLMNALDVTTTLSIDNNDEVVSGMNVIDDTMDNDDNWDFEDDEIYITFNNNNENVLLMKII